MAPSEEYANTSHTLLGRALDLGDQDAWQKLHQTYMSYVTYLLLKIGVRSADIDDVSQAVFVKLSTELPKYDRSRCKFRTWFYSIIKTSALLHFRKETALKNKHDRYQHFGAAEEALEDSAFESLADKEWESFLITKAAERIKQSHSGKALQVFLLDIEGASASEISAQTGLEVASVYTIRKRIKNTLKAELESLIADLES